MIKTITSVALITVILGVAIYTLTYAFITYPERQRAINFQSCIVTHNNNADCLDL